MPGPRLLVWNIRGWCNPLKVRESLRYFSSLSLDLAAILETKLNDDKLHHPAYTIFANESQLDNSFAAKGCRIILKWDSSSIQVTELQVTSQLLHCQITHPACPPFFFTIIYAENEGKGRRKLWEDLIALGSGLSDDPWLVAGDFNCIRFLEEKRGGLNPLAKNVNEFNLALLQAGLDDMHQQGFFFTWNNHKPLQQISEKARPGLMQHQFPQLFPFRFRNIPLPLHLWSLPMLDQLDSWHAPKSPTFQILQSLGLTSPVHLHCARCLVQTCYWEPSEDILK